MRKIGKTQTLSQLKKTADKLFSLAIRYRDGREINGIWWCVCITCGQEAPLKTMHAGHFISRRFNATRWESENVNSQCYGCNIHRYGEQYKYGKEIDLKYGMGTADKLYKLAHSEFKLTRKFLEEIIEDAKKEINYYQDKTD